LDGFKPAALARFLTPFSHYRQPKSKGDWHLPHAILPAICHPGSRFGLDMEDLAGEKFWLG